MRRITWSRTGDRAEVLERLSREFEDATFVEGAPDPRVSSELDEFFAGDRTRFDLAVDPRPTSAFQERVLRRLMHTRFGELLTYGDLANAVDRPGAARAVGRVMATNPLPIVIPCHRVLPANRSLGNYTGGVHVKEFLLRLEGNEFDVPLLDAGW